MQRYFDGNQRQKVVGTQEPSAMPMATCDLPDPSSLMLDVSGYRWLNPGEQRATKSRLHHGSDAGIILENKSGGCSMLTRKEYNSQYKTSLMPDDTVPEDCMLLQKRPTDTIQCNGCYERLIHTWRTHDGYIFTLNIELKRNEINRAIKEYNRYVRSDPIDQSNVYSELMQAETKLFKLKKEINRLEMKSQIQDVGVSDIHFSDERILITDLDVVTHPNIAEVTKTYSTLDIIGAGTRSGGSDGETIGFGSGLLGIIVLACSLISMALKFSTGILPLFFLVGIILIFFGISKYIAGKKEQPSMYCLDIHTKGGSIINTQVDGKTEKDLQDIVSKIQEVSKTVQEKINIDLLTEI